ncbi:MAG TPA: DUF2795 domain-containing protein [Myxococcaceae bacterium]|nr:DUF2795 domain-containing protein [Myxococcaceae bacterium]
MAFGLGENPWRSPAAQLDMVEFPIWREQLARQAADNGAHADVINLFKCLPQARYDTKDGVMRDLSEAARRFAMGGSREDDGAIRDRRNIGRDMVEGAPEGMTRHP